MFPNIQILDRFDDFAKSLDDHSRPMRLSGDTWLLWYQGELIEVKLDAHCMTLTRQY